MTSLEQFAPQGNAPKGWEEFAEQIGQIGKAIVKLPTPDATHSDLLLSAGFNPDAWQIAGKVNVRRWMRYDQEWLYYYKFDVVAGVESDDQRQADVDSLIKHLRKRKPMRTLASTPTFGGGFVYSASDWQLGKREGANGTEQTVEKVAASVDQAVAHIKHLRRAGHAMPHGSILATGDLVEGTCGFYPNMSFLIDANRREQNRLGRQLLTYALDNLAPLFDRFTVATVAGNHGENREGGKKVTDDGDNDDVAIFEGVKEAFDRWGGFPHLEWVIPDSELSLLVNVGGVPVGLTHGHLFSSGGKMVQAKALEWWRGQDFGFQPVREAKILVSSHFHHFSVIEHGPRTHFQTPAMDPGSRWVANAWGTETPSGALTFRVDPDNARGWDDIKVLAG